MTKDKTPRQRGRAWMQRRARWLSMYPLCVECMKVGHVTEAKEVDHIVPLFNGGADDFENYQSLCVEHHQAKTRTDLGWAPAAGCDARGNPTDPSHHWNREGAGRN